jgi:hypothetical protein
MYLVFSAFLISLFDHTTNRTKRRYVHKGKQRNNLAQTEQNDWKVSPVVFLVSQEGHSTHRWNRRTADHTSNESVKKNLHVVTDEGKEKAEIKPRI